MEPQPIALYISVLSFVNTMIPLRMRREIVLKGLGEKMVITNMFLPPKGVFIAHTRNNNDGRIR